MFIANSPIWSWPEVGINPDVSDLIGLIGTGMSTKDTDYMPKGGTGVGVRLLLDIAKNW